MPPSTATEERGSIEQEPQDAAELDDNVAGALTYVLGFVTGIVFYVIKSDNEFVRFHAAQSIVVFGGIFVLGIVLSFISGTAALFGGGVAGGFAAAGISMLVGLVSFVVWIAALAIWIYLMVRTYQGADPRVPGAAGIAKRIS